jgi:hypothetical protein
VTLLVRAGLALGLGGLVGCANLIGIDDEQDDVAEELCQCPDAIASFNGKPCADYVAGRLASAAPATRSAWMQSFDQHCASSCDGCWVNVFSQRPTCSDPGDDCQNDDCGDCCNTTPANSELCG